MTGTDVAIAAKSELAIGAGQTAWTERQLAALRHISAENASMADLEVFFHQCARTGLDPFARQIYLVNYGGKPTIQVGIDGFRLTARRAADKAGETLEWEDAQWCGEDGQWVDVWLRPGPPSATRAVVLRQGQRYPAIALYSEYVARKRDGSVNSQWSTRPAHMLQKCAQALALRMAFPHDLSGMHVDAELEHLNNPPTVQGTVVRSTLAECLQLVADASTYDELRAIWDQHGPALPLADRAKLQKACAAAAEALRAAETPTPAPEPNPEPQGQEQPAQEATEVDEAELVADSEDS